MSKRTVVIADPDEAASVALAQLVEATGLKALRARGPREVLAQLTAGAGVDALFLDLKSPDMKGGHLLAELRRRNLTVPVVICTAGARKDDVVFALRHGCVDWIDKPADRAAVSNALRRVAREAKRQAVGSAAQVPAAKARALIQEIVEKVRQGNIALPEVPDVVHKLRALLADMTVDSEQVLKVLERDPSIAARIISTANTVTYGGRGRITDLKSAITRLGNRTIASIAQTAAFRGLFAFRSPAFKQVFKSMWQGHLVSACITREVGRQVQLKGDADELYLLGLLHNAGEPFLLRVFAEIFMRQSNQVLSMEEVLGVIRDWHTIFGASLMQKWNMGEKFETVARLHHEIESYDASQLGEETVRQLHVVNVGDRLVEMIGPTFYPQPPDSPSLEDSYDYLGITSLEDRDKLRKRAEEIRDEMEALA